MVTVSAIEAQSNFHRLLDDIARTHDPVLITGKRANAVLISEDDWRAIEETIYLLSISSMRESIMKGLDTPLDECVDEVE